MDGNRAARIGIVGTFDVTNFGDLLFPLLARYELETRLGAVDLRVFSYHAKSMPPWPFEVAEVADLPRVVDELDALLVGGGYLIRFDDFVAEDYLPPRPGVDHPTGYWLTPGLLALSRGVPLVWNGPGMHDNRVPAWALPAVRATLANAAYAAVRDEATRAALVASGVTDPVEVVPDTAFGLPRLLADGTRDRSVDALLARADVRRPFVAIQATSVGLDAVLGAMADSPDLFDDLDILALPVGRVLGEDPVHITSQLPHARTLADWPHPLDLAGVVARAEGVVGPSYHLAIAAITAGVPVLSTADPGAGKYTALAALPGMHHLPDDEVPAAWLRGLFGRGQPPDLPVIDAALAAHWDAVAVAVSSRPASRRHVDVAGLPTAPPREETDALGVRRTLTPTHNGTRRAMLDTTRLGRAHMNTDPFAWAEIDRLFAPDDAERLAATYPTDHFRTIEAYGGEKDYHYDVRNLVPMTGPVPSWPADLSPEWSILARDLAGEEYRRALSVVTGVDLADHPMEANVYHYGPRSLLGPHQDLPEKVVVHVLYFNRTWAESDGGCLAILRSRHPADVAAVVLPLLGNSALFVRSPESWHEVRPVAPHCLQSRRSLVVTFYEPGSVSPMWTDESYDLHDYSDGHESTPGAKADEVSAPAGEPGHWWSRLRPRR